MHRSAHFQSEIGFKFKTEQGKHHKRKRQVFKAYKLWKRGTVHF